MNEDSNMDGIGIAWDDASQQSEEDLGLLFWDDVASINESNNGSLNSLRGGGMNNGGSQHGSVVSVPNPGGENQGGFSQNVLNQNNLNQLGQQQLELLTSLNPQAVMNNQWNSWGSEWKPLPQQQSQVSAARQPTAQQQFPDPQYQQGSQMPTPQQRGGGYEQHSSVSFQQPQQLQQQPSRDNGLLLQVQAGQSLNQAFNGLPTGQNGENAQATMMLNQIPSIQRASQNSLYFSQGSTQTLQSIPSHHQESNSNANSTFASAGLIAYNHNAPTSVAQGNATSQSPAIPATIPRQAHPFYLWMLQQQQQGQQVQWQQQEEQSVQQQQQQQQQEQVKMLQKEQEAKRQQQEAERQQREQEAQLKQQQELAQAQASFNDATRPSSNSNSLTPQQQQQQHQLALFQYQLAMAAQQNSNANPPQVTQQATENTGAGGENYLIQQQLQLFQALRQQQQQVQPQQQQHQAQQQAQYNAQSVQSLPGASPFEAMPLSQAMSPLNNNSASAPMNVDPIVKPAAKPSGSRKKKGVDSSKAQGMVPAHLSQAAGAIGSTMKSLNNTMKTINVSGVQHQQNQHGFETTESQVSLPEKPTAKRTPSNQRNANDSNISGSMRSMNSTLASTMRPPNDLGRVIPQGNLYQGKASSKEDSRAQSLLGAGMTISQNQFAQQQQEPLRGTPMIAYTANAQDSATSSTFPQAAVTSNINVVSSDTEGETFAARKRAKPLPHDRYATESGTDDDIIDISTHVAEAAATDEEEKIKSSRERNREHAKNTRLRKKAYIESLKLTVDELCRERDTLVSERSNAASIKVETHSKRVDVLRSFFALRAGYLLNQKRELWSSILDESGFTCRLPVTPYQSFPSSEVQLSNCQRTISGVDAMIADVASNAVFLDSLVDRYHYPKGKINFQYTLATEESVTAGNQIMARWSMETLNAKKCGARTELHQQGMLFCKFNSAHKIVSLEIMFDVMAFMLQVKMAMGFENFNDVVIPNTVQTCQKQYDYPMVITLADRPYTIVQVNERWENLTGYKGADVVGKCSCSILQGADTGRKELKNLMSPVLFKRPSCGMLTNYTKHGRRFRSYITIYPLSTDSTISHYFGLTTFVQWIDADESTKPQDKDGSDYKLSDKGDYDQGYSKRPRESARGPSSSSQKSKRAKMNENSSSSCSDGTSINAVKVVVASNQDKQSLSSLTSSISSSSISRESGNGTDANDTFKDANSVAVLVPSRAKASVSTSATTPSSLAGGAQKVEFSVPLVLNCPESSKCKSEEKDKK
eukprot:CCRYP_001561-RA/>CCRYP_001561-RA protein AED:0.10 eAED:0.10 QI:243/1/1/1/1/1/3/201/1267